MIQVKTPPVPRGNLSKESKFNLSKESKFKGLGSSEKLSPRREARLG